MDKAQECVGGAYILLLTVPHDSPRRLRMQSVLAALRDELAELTGNTAEDVQNTFEALQNTFEALRNCH